MKGNKIIIRLSLFFVLFFFFGCGATKEVNLQAYFNKLQASFTFGTNKFFEGDYNSAKNIFTNYNQFDSNYFNYESYAFLAECYNRLEMQDSGLIIYQSIIQKLKNEAKTLPKSSRFEQLIIDDLENWYSSYPDFPKYLLKENGFVPYDDMPDPIGGIGAIQQYLEYPLVPSGEKLEGKVYVLTLIDEYGKPVDFYVIKSLAEPYDVAAMNAVRRVNFTIPKRKGNPHKVWVIIPIEFRLK